jgi:hypothetical protein
MGSGGKVYCRAWMQQRLAGSPMKINASTLEDQNSTNYDPCLTYFGPPDLRHRHWVLDYTFPNLQAATGAGTGGGLSRSHGDDGAIGQDNEPLAGAPGPSELHCAHRGLSSVFQFMSTITAYCICTATQRSATVALTGQSAPCRHRLVDVIHLSHRNN